MMKLRFALALLLVLLLSSFSYSLQLREASHQKVLNVLENKISTSAHAHLGVDSATIPQVPNSVPTTSEPLPSWVIYLICAIGIVVGLIECFYGYRFFYVTVFFICGFIGAVIITLILEASLAQTVANRAAIIAGVGLAVWIVFGIICVFLIEFAIFLMGASIGVIIALVLNEPLIQYIWPAQPETCLILFCILFGIITGLIVLCLERPLIIAATAVFGGFLVIYSIGAICGNLPVYSNTTNYGSVPWEWYAYFGGLIALILFGSLIQVFYTAAGYNHRGDTPPGYQKV